MPEPLIHFAVPFASLSLIGVKPKLALIASIFAVLPDLDVLFYVHKSITHSIILLLLITITAYSFLKKSYGELILLCSLGVASHMILDLFSCYTPILWPLYDRSLWVSFGLNAHFGSPFKLIPSLQILTEPTSLEPFQSLDAEVITSEGIMVSMILLGPTIFLYLKNYLQNKMIKKICMKNLDILV